MDEELNRTTVVPNCSGTGYIAAITIQCEMPGIQFMCAFHGYGPTEHLALRSLRANLISNGYAAQAALVVPPGETVIPIPEDEDIRHGDIPAGD